MMKRKVLATLLSASMCITLMPMMALAKAIEYGVWVNGEQFTSDKLIIECGSGTATYNPTDNELTLSYATITAGCYEGAIRVNDGIDIILQGTNAINLSSDDYCYGIYTDDNLLLTGDGSLDITVENNGYDGIWSRGDLTIDMSGKLTIDAGDDGIYAENDLMVTGSGDIDITADYYGMYSSCTDIILSGSGDIKIDAYYAIYSEDGNIDISGSANLDLDANEDAIYADKDIKLSGSGDIDIDVTLDSADDGICSSGGNIYISTSGELNINSRYGIFCSVGTVDISASGNINVNTTGGTGVYAENSITISGSGDIIVKSSEARAFGFAGNLVLSGTGKVTGISESNDYYCVDIFSSEGAVLLNGKNTEVSFTSADGCYAVYNSTNSEVGTVAGDNIDKYDVTGAPEESSVVYTLKSHEITFDMGGHGDAIETQKIYIDNSAEKPEDPTASGWTFGGWYSDDAFTTEFDFDSIINEDTTLYAKWTCNHEHTEIKNAKDATKTEQGYTGDTYCTDCGEKIKDGEAIPTLTPDPTPAPGGDPSGDPTPTPDGGKPTPSADPTPTTEPTPTPSKAPELNVGDFVDRCYEVALGREADEDGYNYWKDMLVNGEACGAQVGYGFIFSGEYGNKNTTNEQFVTDMYAMFFGREADEEGYNYWLEQLNNETADRQTVFAGFANSQEFYNLCEKYGVVSGAFIVDVPNDQQGGVNCFVARLYKVCLNRLPDIGGQAGWVQKLLSGEVTGTTCAYGFVFSEEFTNLNLDNSDFVKYMYKAFFGREADEDGLNYWVEQLNNGTATREDIFAGFSGSAEFANLCAGYGINA